MADPLLFWCPRCETVRSENLTYVDSGERYDAICSYEVEPYALPVPRCATCLHWDRFSGSNEGECFRIVAGGSAPMLATKYSAALVTPPDFGCTEHTPRLAEEKNP